MPNKSSAPNPGKLSSYEYDRIVGYLSLVKGLGRRDVQMALELYREIVEDIPPPDVNSEEGFTRSRFFRSRGAYVRARRALVKIGLLGRLRGDSGKEKRFVHGDSMMAVRGIAEETERIKEKLSAVFLEPAKLPEMQPAPDFERKRKSLEKASAVKRELHGRRM